MNVPVRVTARKGEMLRDPVATVRPVGRKVDVDDLVGAAEIAERLGRGSASLIHDWRRRYSDFPSPVLELRQGHVWHWPAVEAWARATGRL